MRLFIHSIVCLLFACLNCGCCCMPGDELRAETTLTYGADRYAYAADAGVACTEGTATEGKRFADKDQKGADRLTDLSHPEHRTPVAMLSGNDNSVRINSPKPQRLLPTNCSRTAKLLAKLHSLFYNNPQKLLCSGMRQPQRAVILPVVSCHHFIALRHIIR